MIYKKIACFFCMALVISMLMGVSGCMENRQKFSIDECLEYMNKKYGEEFTFEELYDDEQPTSRMLKIYVRSEKYDEKILVVQEESGGVISFHDNYVAAKYHDELNSVYERVFCDIYGECRFISYSKFGLLPDSFDGTTSFEEYTSEYCNDIGAEILLPPDADREGKEDKLTKLYEELRSEKILGTYTVTYTTDAEKYAGISTTLEAHQGEGWYDCFGSFSMNSDFELKFMYWR